MEYQDIKHWLDELIRLKSESKSLENFNSEIQSIIYSYPEIQLFNGIEIIVDIMGLKLFAKRWRDNKTEYSFRYEGVKFFQIGSSDDEDKAFVR